MIVHEELTQMLGKNYANYFSKEGVIGFGERRIDRGFLLKAIGDFDKRFYVCGPDTFIDDISGYLIELGACMYAVII